MRSTKFTRPVYVVFLALGSAALLHLNGGQARASIVGADLFLLGDQLITRDTSTGLEWLDMPVTLGLSYNQAEASTFVTNLGFRHANTTEVIALFVEFGMTDFSPSFQNVNYLGARDFIEKLGPGVDTGNFDALEGFVDLDPFDTNLTRIATIDAATNGNDTGRVGISSLFSAKDYNSGFTANFLVRPTPRVVPEPSCLAIWSLLASVGVRISHRPKRKSKAD